MIFMRACIGGREPAALPQRGEVGYLPDRLATRNGRPKKVVVRCGFIVAASWTA
jgi:hypothetical protein